MKKQTMRQAGWVTAVLLCIAACAGAERPDSRIVRFPSTRSMGMLYVLDWDQVDTSSYNDWQLLCEATGDVTVPAGKALRLDLSKGVMICRRYLRYGLTI